MDEGETPEAGKYTAQYVAEWIHRRRFIRVEFTMKVKGEADYTATTIIGYDEGKKRIVASGFSCLGVIAHSEEVITKKKDVWIFKGKASLDGTIIEDRVTETKVDEDTFTATTEIKKDGKYEVLDTSTWKRKK